LMFGEYLKHTLSFHLICCSRMNLAPETMHAV
jgi:hypothetical protein